MKRFTDYLLAFYESDKRVRQLCSLSEKILLSGGLRVCLLATTLRKFRKELANELNANGNQLT
jgi:hypothetical protein